jgi:AcrR family transcriptional regulator
MRKATTEAKIRRKETTPRDADASRARIFERAKVLFSQNTYEGVGMRDIASAAGVDPALVIRYFGSKENLFREIAEQAFGAAEFLKDGVVGLAENTANVILSDIDESRWRTGYDPLRLLLASIGSPTAGPILAACLQRDFVKPLGDAIGGNEAAERGMALSAWIVGFSLMRVAASVRSRGAPSAVILRRLLVDTVLRTVASGSGRRESIDKATS